jgi:hypothetical protein
LIWAWHPPDRLGVALEAIFWGIWAVDEVLRGINPWRRFLGAAGAAVLCYGLWTLRPWKKAACKQSFLTIARRRNSSAARSKVRLAA